MKTMDKRYWASQILILWLDLLDRVSFNGLDDTRDGQRLCCHWI